MPVSVPHLKGTRPKRLFSHTARRTEPAPDSEPRLSASLKLTFLEYYLTMSIFLVSLKPGDSIR